MKKKRFISMLICIAMVVTMAPCIVSAADGVAINATNFPDANFRNYVLSNHDKNSNNSLDASEIAVTTQISVSFSSISSLEGIEYFTALTDLYCSNNNLTTLDVSNNTALEFLVCGDNNLTTLDVSNNTALTDLVCSNNNLTTLDVSNNTVLESLSCYDNNLTTLDVSNFALEFLLCWGNNISTLDISCVPELLRVVNEGSESVFTLDGYEVREFFDDESGLACDLSTTIVTNPPVTEEPTSTVAPVRPSVDRTQAELFVTRCYEEALNRTPDSEGLANWTNSLVDRSLSGTQLAYGIIFSPEFMNNNYSNEVFVTILYNVCLNRAPDADGLNNWVTALNNGADRLEVFRGFAHSDEFTGICNNYGIVRGSI